jgi:hypothetical protein
MFPTCQRCSAASLCGEVTGNLVWQRITDGMPTAIGVVDVAQVVAAVLSVFVQLLHPATVEDLRRWLG